MTNGIRTAEIVLGCDELDDTLSFFTDTLGFRVEAIFPADDPRVAVIVGHGTRLRLERGGGDPGRLRIACDDPRVFGGVRAWTAPNGTRVELVEAHPPVALPPLAPGFVLTRPGEGSGWVTGRAGMQYRDLIPDRQGGRFIASHIRIPDGGPVPDYVHYHRIRFQMIFCHRGWVRVVYEDQGPPFVMEAGDCVLQPPEIRHRVLECSPGLEVIELGCPAEHETRADLDLELPTRAVRADRSFEGQRFVRHHAADAEEAPWRIDGWRARDTGIAEATGGLASARIARAVEPPAGGSDVHDGELLFLFVRAGSVGVSCDAAPAQRIGPDDAVVLPPGRFTLQEPSDDAELLEVVL